MSAQGWRAGESRRVDFLSGPATITEHELREPDGRVVWTIEHCHHAHRVTVSVMRVGEVVVECYSGTADPRWRVSTRRGLPLPERVLVWFDEAARSALVAECGAR